MATQRSPSFVGARVVEMRARSVVPLEAMSHFHDALKLLLTEVAPTRGLVPAVCCGLAG
jgi:hypothetical protein